MSCVSAEFALVGGHSWLAELVKLLQRGNCHIKVSYHADYEILDEKYVGRFTFIMFLSFNKFFNLKTDFNFMRSIGKSECQSFGHVLFVVSHLA